MQISIGDINEYLGYSRTRKSSLGSPEFRALAEIPTGKISLQDFIEPLSKIREIDFGSGVGYFTTIRGWQAGVQSILGVGARGFAHAESADAFDHHLIVSDGETVIGDGRINPAANSGGWRAYRYEVNGAGVVSPPIVVRNHAVVNSNSPTPGAFNKQPQIMGATKGNYVTLANVTRTFANENIRSDYCSLYKTSDNWLTWSLVTHNAPNGAKVLIMVVRPSYLSDTRDAIFVCVGGTAYYVPDVFVSTGWELLPVNVGNLQDSWIYMHTTMIDKNNWCMGKADKFYRDGAWVSASSHNYWMNLWVVDSVNMCYWSAGTKFGDYDHVHVSCVEIATGNATHTTVKDAVWGGRLAPVGIRGNSTGMMFNRGLFKSTDAPRASAIQFKFKGVGVENLEYVRHINSTGDSAFSSLQTPWYASQGAHIHNLAPDYSYNDTGRNFGINTWISSVGFTYADTEKRTDEFVLLNPQYADVWAKTRKTNRLSGLLPT